MQEKVFLIDIDPVIFLGPSNTHLNYLTSTFNKLKLISRGNEIKAIGNEEELILFEAVFNKLIEHYNKFNNLTINEIKNIISDGKSPVTTKYKDENFILFGNYSKAITAKTINQQKLLKEVEKNDLLFAIGPAGTGKTYTAIALAVRALKERQVRRIILTRPAVEAGEQLGYLPGDLKDKLDPYLQPLYDALFDMIPARKLNDLFDDKIIEIAPLAFMRGRTLDNAFVILDEAQNASYSQLKMFLTRMGQNAKFIITGDLTQVDLPEKSKSGLKKVIDRLNNIEEISIVNFDKADILRHRVVKKIINALSKE